MDEYSTPLNQIRPELSEQSNMNYSDVLQSMEQQQQQPQPQQMSEPQYPPPPIVQSRNEMNQMQQPTHHQIHQIMSQQHPQVEQNKETEANMSQIQKDFIYLVVPSILLYSTPIQNHLLRTIPSLFKDEKPTIIGNIINASIIAIIFIGLKNMKVQFN